MHVDELGRVGFDLTCAQCGYNLRGLPGAGECPECGTAVAISAHGSPLTAADPEWLATVRRGAAAMTLAFPWLWLPLVWPVFLQGLWRLAKLPPSDQRPSWPSPSVVFEFFALLLLFTPLWPITVAICVRRLAKRGKVKGLMACASWVMLLMTIVATGAAAAALDEALGMQESLLVLGIGVAVAAALALLVLLYVMLAWTWRLLDAAETQSRDVRESPGAWRLTSPIRAPGVTRP